MEPVDQPAQRAPALAGVLDEIGDLVAEVHGAGHQRLGEEIDQAGDDDEAPEKDERGRHAVGEPPSLEEAHRRREEHGEEERDHDVEHDLAQHPQPDDEGCVQIDEGDGDGGGHDDGGQRHPPATRILTEPARARCRDVHPPCGKHYSFANIGT